MKTNILLFVAMGLAMPFLSACQPETEAPNMDDLNEPKSCGANELSYLIGQPLVDFNALNHQGVVRIIRPGQAVTMDYRIDRLNVVLDEDDVITGMNCS